MKEISATKAIRLRRGSPRKSNSWDWIVQRYAHLVEQHRSYEPMLNLVRTLVSSPAAKELYPHTWMFRLVIASENEWYDDDNLLTIEYDCCSHTFTFEHLTLSGKNDKKICTEEEAFETLRLFLKYKFAVLLNPRQTK